MAFRSGALSVRRYSVEGELSEAFTRTASTALRRYAFRPIDAERGERESFGWIDPRRVLDEKIEWENVVDGNLAFLGVRRDRKSFNKVLFRARRDEMFEEVKKERGLARLTRQHRLAIEEQLTVQMLREATPVTAFTEIVWDMNTGDVFVGATSKAICDRIVDLFLGTFDVRLMPRFPAITGFRVIEAQGLEENFALASAAVSQSPGEEA